MNKRQIVARTAGAIVMVGALLGATSLAQAKENDAADARARVIEGVWLPIVTLVDCETKVAMGVTFPSMELYVRGGGLVAFGAVQKSDQVGMGAWWYVGGRTFKSEYTFFGWAGGPPGAPDAPPDGTLLKVSSTIRLNAAGTTFTTSEISELVDVATGNVLARGCATRRATRLQ